MPSPFSGMHPYLEGARYIVPLRTTFHFAFGAEIVRQLALRLRPRYLVLPVERLVIEASDDIAITANICPDVGVAKSAIDYTRSPKPLLDDEAMSMADSLLRTAVLRPA